MNILFLGTCTDEKRFFLLSLAKAISLHNKVAIYAQEPYGYDNEDSYDFCGIEIHHLKKDQNLDELTKNENINFLDIGKFISVKNVNQVVAVCEPLRKNLKESVELVSRYSGEYGSLELALVYLNILEYCKTDEKYLGQYLTTNLPVFANIIHEYIVFFEEVNRIIMIESQFTEKFKLKDLTSSYKSVLMKLSADILDLDKKEIKKIFRKAERMK